jgi:hypothetical protein
MVLTRTTSLSFTDFTGTKSARMGDKRAPFKKILRKQDAKSKCECALLFLLFRPAHSKHMYG